MIQLVREVDEVGKLYVSGSCRAVIALIFAQYLARKVGKTVLQELKE